MLNHRLMLWNLKRSVRTKECGKEFPSEWSLRSHVQRVHKGVRFKCDLCPKSCTSKDFLSKHIFQDVHETYHPSKKAKKTKKCGNVTFLNGKSVSRVKSFFRAVKCFFMSDPFAPSWKIFVWRFKENWDVNSEELSPSLTGHLGWVYGALDFGQVLEEMTRHTYCVENPVDQAGWDETFWNCQIDWRQASQLEDRELEEGVWKRMSRIHLKLLTLSKTTE